MMLDSAEMPIWIVAVVTMVVVVVKLIQLFLNNGGKKESKFSLDTKMSGKKKKSKKQRPVDISEKNLRRETATLDQEAEKPLNLTSDQHVNHNKKSEKKKGKSKKKRSLLDTISSVVEHAPTIEDDGTWETVSTREQRTVQKREKRRQDSLELDVKPPTPVQPHITAQAKEVAPRFARAAGEGWVEGRKQPVVYRTPMEVLPSGQNGEVPLERKDNKQDVWDNSSSVVGIPLTTPLHWPSASASGDGWCGITSLSAANEWSDTGAKDLQDWVHVEPSATETDQWRSRTSTILQGSRQWSDMRTGNHPEPPAIALMQREEFLLEPEGGAVDTSDIDNPWNLDVEDDKVGDWSPPEAVWSNANVDWDVPSTATKQPTYLAELSGDESKTTTPSSVTAVQTSNQKKSRRRRKKKQPIAEQEEITEIPTTEHEVAVEPEPEIPQLEREPEVPQIEEWNQPKPTKKKKPRVRKDE